MTAQMIRRYAIEAQYAESTHVMAKDAARRTLIGMMKDDGYVPLYDVNEVWQTAYLGGDKFTGTLTMQGVHVGKDVSWQTDGMVDGKLIRSTHRNK